MPTATLPAIKWPLQTLPQILIAGHFPLTDQNFAVNYYSHTHALHVHEYRGIMDIDGRKLQLSPGTVTLSPANKSSSYDLPTPGRHWCIHFHVARSASRMVRLPLHLPADSLNFDITQRIAHIAMLRAAADEDDVSQTAASLALQELLLLLTQRQSPASGKQYVSESQQAINELLEMIHRNLDQNLRVEDIAKKVQLSQNYLAKQFKQRMGKTIPRYILESRINRAQLLLQTTNLPVKQIAAQVGLPDAQHFNKQFRNITGKAPSQMRL